jgi:hypothetical protein
MAEKGKGKQGPARPKFQPTKYDWVTLESEFLAGDIASVAEFCRQRGIPSKTRDRMTVGWGAKRDAIRRAGSKIVAKGLAHDYAEAVKAHLNWGAGLIKIAVDALVPQGADNLGMKPQTAAEAAKMLHLGTVIQKNAIVMTGLMEEMLKDKTLESVDGNDERPVRTVIIDIPSNGKEAKELPGK